MKICEMCASTVFGDRYIRSPIAALERPSAISASTSRSRSVSSSSGPRARLRATRRDTIVGIDHALALADPPQRVGEHGDVGHALLEQVARALGHVLQQPHRVVRLEVVREHEHADLRVAAADLLGGDEPVVGVGRRHADVHDGDVRAPRIDHPQQRVGIAAAPDDLEAGVLEQPREPVAQQRLVVGDQDSHGSSASSSCAPG